MDKKEYILKSLSNIGLNNKILELETDLELEKSSNKISSEKAKKIISELIINNKKIETEKKKLEEQLLEKQNEIEVLKEQNIYNQKVINKVPKLFLKFILKNKDIKLIEKE